MMPIYKNHDRALMAAMSRFRNYNGCRVIDEPDARTEVTDIHGRSRGIFGYITVVLKHDGLPESPDTVVLYGDYPKGSEVWEDFIYRIQ